MFSWLLIFPLILSTVVLQKYSFNIWIITLKTNEKENHLKFEMKFKIWFNEGEINV